MKLDRRCAHLSCWLAIAAACSALAAPPEFHAAVTASNPQLWYKFDEPQGATTVINYGSYGAAFNGAYRNGASPGATTCDGDTGASFNHLQQHYVESLAAAPASLTGNPSFTVEAVVRVASITGNPFYAPFLHWGAASTGRSVYFSLFGNTTNRAYAGFYNGGLRMVGTFTNPAYNHLVWIRDSAGGANGQWQGSTLYLNGQVVPLEPDNALPGAPVINVTSTTLRVQRATDQNRYFTGTMDEVVLYDHLLTPAEVAAHFATLDQPCLGDVNGDGQVSLSDLTILLSQFGSTNAMCSAADLDRDDDVDLSDLTFFLAHFGESCP